MSVPTTTGIGEAVDIMGDSFVTLDGACIEPGLRTFYRRPDSFLDSVPYPSEELWRSRHTHWLVPVPAVTISEMYPSLRDYFHPGVDRYFIHQDCMHEQAKPGWYLLPRERLFLGEVRLPVAAVVCALLAVYTAKGVRVLEHESLPTATRLPNQGTVFVGHFDEAGMFFFTGQR